VQEVKRRRKEKRKRRKEKGEREVKRYNQPNDEKK
jgi:hypothetical protein